MFGASKVRAIVLVVALVLCQALFCNSPDKMQRAKDLLAKGSLSEAVAVLRQVVLDDPGNLDAHLTLGTALALQGLRDQSLKEIQTAIDLSPNSARARNQLGVVQSSYLETGAARKAFEDALLFDPNFAEAHLNLAMILAQTGELTLAREHLDKAIGLYGAVQPAAKAYFLRAKVWSAQGDNDDATIDLEEATRLDSGYQDAWFDLSQLKHSKGDLQGALTAAQRVVGLNPKNAEAQSWLGRCYLENSDAPRAIKHLQIARSLGVDDKATLYSLERALRATGKMEDAKQLEQDVLKEQRLDTHAGEVLFTASGLNEEGLRLEHQGDILGALDKYRAAVDLDPTGYGFRLNYALALCRTGRWQEAITQLHEVLKEDPDNTDAAKALLIAQEKIAQMKM